MQEKIILAARKALLKGAIGGFLLIGFGGVDFVHAEALEKKAVVYFVATLEDNPAFAHVKWKIYRLNGGHYQQVYTFSKHSSTLELKRGHYKAVASLNGTTRSITFTLKPDTKRNVIIPMD